MLRRFSIRNSAVSWSGAGALLLAAVVFLPLSRAALAQTSPSSEQGAAAASPRSPDTPSAPAGVAPAADGSATPAPAAATPAPAVATPPAAGTKAPSRSPDAWFAPTPKAPSTDTSVIPAPAATTPAPAVATPQAAGATVPSLAPGAAAAPVRAAPASDSSAGASSAATPAASVTGTGVEAASGTPATETPATSANLPSSPSGTLPEAGASPEAAPSGASVPPPAGGESAVSPPTLTPTAAQTSGTSPVGEEAAKSHAAGAATASTAESARVLDRIIAVVNDDVITLGELDYRIRLAEVQLTRQRIPMPPADVLRKQILERLILDKAQLQLAKETGVRVDDGTVNSAVGRMAEQNGMNIAAMRVKVEADGVPFNQFREDMRDEITMMRVRDREVDAKIQISEGEIDNFLQEQSSVAANSVQYDVAQILIGVPEIASPEFVERARRRAEDLLAQLRSGADFGRLAAGYSAAPEALQGGDLGWRSIDRLPGLFADAVRKLKPGEIALVRSPVGFHILKLVGQRDAANVHLSNQPVAQTHARHILLRVSDALPEPEVKHRLLDLRERVAKGGQDFGQLARLYSVDPSSTRGGDLGWLYPGDTVPAFENAMNALKINEISEPVQSPFGWHLIQVLERRTEESSVERKRLEARQALKDRKAEEALQEWLRQLRDRTYVEYRVEDNR